MSDLGAMVILIITQILVSFAIPVVGALFVYYREERRARSREETQEAEIIEFRPRRREDIADVLSVEDDAIERERRNVA